MNHPRRFTLLLTAIWFCGSAGMADDLLYLQDGKERVGELIAITDGGVVFRIKGMDVVTTFPHAKVQRIDLAQQRQGDDIGRVDELNDSLIDRLRRADAGRVQYPDSGHLVLYYLLEKRLHKDGSYTQRERRVEKVLQERGKEQADVARYFKKGEETLEIDFARTINPDGTVTPISRSAIDTTSVNADAPEYEKLYQIKFAMKKVGENSILDYQVTKRRSQTDLLNPFAGFLFFREDEPILEIELRLIVPRGVKLAYASERDQNIKFSTEKSGDEVIYSFTARNCPRIEPEPFMPPAGDCYPMAMAAVQTTWCDIGDAFRDATIRAGAPSAELTAQVRELVAGVDDVEEKARRVYEYFAKNFRQIWVDPAEFDYAPRPAGDVFHARAGNTIDKAALLRLMLVEAGAPADIVLCRTQGEGSLIEGIPCIRQFNDALVSVSLPSGRTFLPVDNEDARFGQIPAEYQDTRGLLVTGSDAELVTIPLNEADDERFAVHCRMRIDAEGDLIVTKDVAATGNFEIGLRSEWKDRKEEEIRRALEISLAGIHSKAHLDSYAFDHLQDLSQSATFSKTYTLTDYVMRAGDDLLVFRLPELRYSAAPVGPRMREFPLQWSTRSKMVNDLTVEVPDGFRVYHAGKAYQHEAGPAGFAAVFETSEREVHYHDEYVHHHIKAPREDYDNYKACLETMARTSNEWIVLERAPTDEIQ